MFPDMNTVPFIDDSTLFIELNIILSSIILFVIARNRIKPHLKKEWSVEYNFQSTFRRNITNPLGKLFSEISISNSEKLALLVRNEITSNSAIVFEKTPIYFIRHRSDPTQMINYFSDPELLEFLADPKGWARANGGVKRSLFGKNRIQETASEEYMECLKRVMEKFSLDVIKARGASFKLFSDT